MKYFIVVLMWLVLILSFKQSPKFSKNDCAKWYFNNEIRKVLKVKKYVYKYCILVDNKCGDRLYTVRINTFDRIMEKIKCKENK